MPTKYRKYLPFVANTETLVANSPQTYLIHYYNRLRKKLSLKKFHKRCHEFYCSIMIPLNNFQLDQNLFIRYLMEMIETLPNLPSFLSLHFQKHIHLMNIRLDLARIDHNVNQNRGIKSTFDLPNFPINIRIALNELVGKVFIITQTPSDTSVKYSGSATLCLLNGNDIENINGSQTGQLNSILTCSHMLDVIENEHVMGFYFVPNNNIDRDTGLPTGDIQIVNDKISLINYLNDSNNSYRINFLRSKRRDKFPPFQERTNFEVSKPQYWDKEDISIGEIALKPNQSFKSVQADVQISFSPIRNTEALNFANGERYFAIGYAGLYHHDSDLLVTHHQYQLVKEIGVSPLVVTSNISQSMEDLQLSEPRFLDGAIQHCSPTTAGMSGGPLIRISNNQIDVFGVINGRNKNNKYYNGSY